jgi:hypothetical protein
LNTRIESKIHINMYSLRDRKKVVDEKEGSRLEGREDSSARDKDVDIDLTFKNRVVVNF